MDMVLKICISDGSEIIADGFDEISFYNELPNAVLTRSAYYWQRESYNELLNNLVEYNFISIKRKDPTDRLEYRNVAFAFKNSNFEKDDHVILQTKCITTIIDM